MKPFDWRQIQVLISEDEEELREMLVILFEERGCKVFSAPDGEAAYEILMSERIDLIVSDVRMPKCDGIELLKKVREKHASIPVVFLATGFADITAEEAKTRGASGLLHKPFSTAELFKAIERALTDSFPQFMDETRP